MNRRYSNQRRKALRLERLEPRCLLSTTPLITEFMASNSSTLDDGDGNSSDWIEIHNPTAAAIDLAGWHLTDDATDQAAWTFPSLPQSVLDPGEYLVVFASGQATDTYVDLGGNLHTNFKLGAGGEYLGLTDPSSVIVHEYAPEYPAQQSDVSYGLGMIQATSTVIQDGDDWRLLIPSDGSVDATWMTNAFVDTGWQLVPTGIGYEDSTGYDPYLNTDVPSGTSTIYIRMPFNVVDASQVSKLTLRMRYDDGFAAYINGQLVESQNAPTTLDYQSEATANHSDSQAIEFVEFDLTAYLDKLQDGSNLLAVHGLNDNVPNISSDFLISPELVIETAALIEPFDIGFFSTATPGAANTDAFEGLVADTSFTVDRGFYDTPFDTVITTTSPGAIIVHTTDGSEPTLSNGTQVLPPDANTPPSATVNIATTTILRAAAFKTGFAPTNVDTHTYIFTADVVQQPSSLAGFPTTFGTLSQGATIPADYQVDPDIVNGGPYTDSQGITFDVEDGLKAIPTLSVVMEYDDLWESAEGIIQNVWRSTTNPTVGNVGVASERPMSLELINPDGSPGFQVDAGIRLFGYGTRIPAKKAFRVLFKGIYGPTKLDFPLFEGHGVNRFDTLMIRSGDDNWLWGFISQRAKYIADQWHRDTEKAMGRIQPEGSYVHLYLNGLYWGVYNLFERPDASFMAQHYGGDKDEYDAINARGGVLDAVDGDTVAFLAAQSMATAGLSNLQDYLDFQEYVDVDDLIDFFLISWYSGNEDWAGDGNKNWRAARKREVGAQFKFFSWDADTSFVSGWKNDNSISFNAVSRTTNHSNNPTRFLFGALSNEEFKILLADHIHRHLFNDGALTPDEVEPRWDVRMDELDRAILAESARWGDAVSATPFDRDDWLAYRNGILQDWFDQRTGILLGQLEAQGYYPALDAAEFNQHGGLINAGFGLTMSAPAGTIYYTLDGVTDPRDVGGGINAGALTYGPAVTLNDSTTVKARVWDGGEWSALNEAAFNVVPFADATNLRITEIHYNPADPSAAEITAGFTDNDEFEFVELLNIAAEPIELQNVVLSDGVDLTLGSSTVLAPGERVVVVENTAAFEERYGTSIRIIGQWSGGLSNGGETLVLADQASQIILSFTYQDGDDLGEEAWPTTPDGNGPSLVVIDTEGDYNDGANWKASNPVHGTPGSDEVPSIPGDYNTDGTVDQLDYAVWKSTFGSTTDLRADGNGDLIISAADYTIWRDHLGQTLPASVAAPVTILAATAQVATAPLTAAWPLEVSLQKRGMNDSPASQAFASFDAEDSPELPQPVAFRLAARETGQRFTSVDVALREIAEEEKDNLCDLGDDCWTTL